MSQQGNASPEMLAAYGINSSDLENLQTEDQSSSSSSSTTTTPTTTSPLPTRLNIHPFARLLIANFFGFTGTFISTAITTTHTASLQFRAENAHRLPLSQKDWYFYHRSKNYHTAYHAFRNGVLRGWGMCGYVSAFVLTENAVDKARGRVDCLGTVAAGGVTGTLFGVVRKLPLSTTALTMRKGLWYGLLYGVAQDAVLSMRGENVFWIDPFIGRPKGKRKREIEREKEEANAKDEQSS